MAQSLNPVTRIFNLVRLEKKEISAVYFYAILNGLIQLSLPVGVQAIIGFILGGAMSASLYLLIFLVVGGVLVTGLMQINQMKLTEKIQQRIFVRYSFSIARHVPTVDLRSADPVYLPELVNRFFDIPTLQKGLSKLLLDIPAATIQILFGLTLLSFYHPAFILFGLVLLLVLWLILYYSGSRGLSTSLTESSYKYAVAGWIEELARVIRSFKFSKGSDIHLTKTDERVTGYLQARTEHFKILLLQYRTLVAFKVIITASMLLVGAVLLVNQQLNIGQFIAAEIIILTVIASVEKFIVNLDTVYDVLTSVDKIAKITDKPVESEGSYVLPVKAEGLSIQMKDLAFGYDDQKDVISGISLAIAANSKVCITGAEGAGKSTLLKLMSGSLNGFKGGVLINDIPVGNYQLSSLRSQTGVLLGQQDIFHGSLLENITMGNTSITVDEVAPLAALTGLDSFIASLPQGYDTILDPAGRKLSRNVVQKILLVRALAGQPRLLLLEEPLQGLSETCREKISDYLFAKLKQTTVVIASNDPVLVNTCDTVLEMTDTALTIHRKK